MSSTKSARLPKWVQGRQVVDATKGCTINVRAEDIKNAVSQDGKRCVAARCAKRAFGAKHAYFYRTTCYIEFANKQPVERFVIPHRLRKKVVDPLDTGHLEEIEPGRYELKPPPKSYKLGQAAKNRVARLLAGKVPTKRLPFKRRPMLGRVHAAAMA
jgi:hypothetical protein